MKNSSSSSRFLLKEGIVGLVTLSITLNFSKIKQVPPFFYYLFIFLLVEMFYSFEKLEEMLRMRMVIEVVRRDPLYY